MFTDPELITWDIFVIFQNAVFSHIPIMPNTFWNRGLRLKTPTDIPNLQIIQCKTFCIYQYDCCAIQNFIVISKWNFVNDHIFQPEGKGKYVFDIGCQQHGEYIPIEQVSSCSFDSFSIIWPCDNHFRQKQAVWILVTWCKKKHGSIGRQKSY